MGGASPFLTILSIAGFLAAAWSATKFSKIVGISSIVLEITVGILLGPGLVGLMPTEYAECEARRFTDCSLPADFDLIADQMGPNGFEPGSQLSFGADLDKIAMLPPDDHYYCDKKLYDEQAAHDNHATPTGNATEPGTDHHRLLSSADLEESYGVCLNKYCKKDVADRCQIVPGFFVIVGHIGVAMMIFESGMHFDFEMAAEVGPWACVVAVLGTCLPLISGCLLCMAMGKPFYPDGISTGTALAPTSVGIALKLLTEANALQQQFGQTIMTAAFVDDILSLILFNILFSLGSGSISFEVTFLPALLGIVFMLIAIALAVKFWPHVIEHVLLPRAELAIFGKDVLGSEKLHAHEELLFIVMVCFLCGYGMITYLCGTHLWGCFIAGMSFACFDHHEAHEVWVRQTKRGTSWMIRLFFACTVAFGIPVDQLLSLDAFLWGSLMGIGPCIITKVICAPFMGRARWVIGWAMVGRAEFAYLIAAMASDAGMVDQSTYSVLIWALLWATIFAPFIFRFVLNKYLRDMVNDENDPMRLSQMGVVGAKKHVKGTGSKTPLKTGKSGHGNGSGGESPDSKHSGRKSMKAPGVDLDDVRVECEAATTDAWEDGAPGHTTRGIKQDKNGLEGAPIGSQYHDDLLDNGNPRLATVTSMQRVGPNSSHHGVRTDDDGFTTGNGFMCCLFFKKATIS